MCLIPMLQWCIDYSSSSIGVFLIFNIYIHTFYSTNVFCQALLDQKTCVEFPAVFEAPSLNDSLYQQFHWVHS